MTYARQHLVTPDAPGTYHCVSRCVRRAFLCGMDALSGRSFDHRKDWVEDRLLCLSESFAVSVHAYAVMSNHVHLVVYVDPRAPADWSDEEVARRWANAYGGGARSLRSPEQRVRALTANPQYVQQLRDRLGSLSWFMSALLQPIALRANREDEVSGRFWEGRFKSQALLDERAVLSAMAYVDLNPMRAGLARSVELCKHTSAGRRLEQPSPGGALRPVAGLVDVPLTELGEETYLDLIRWAGDASIAVSRPTKEPPAAAQHLISNPECWIRQLKATETRYSHAIGSLDAMLERAKTLRQRWLRGVGFARSLTSPA